MKVLIPDTIALQLASPTDEFVVYDAQAPIPAQHADAELLVLWANSAANLASAVQTLTHVRVVQTLAAGPDQAVAAGFAPQVTICSGRTLHDGPVAEHTLALVLALVRRIDTCLVAQSQHVWEPHIGRDQTQPDTRGWYTLSGATVVILGYGSIAARLHPMLTALGATVVGVATRAGERHGYPVIGMDTVHEVLPTADVLISLLPHTPATERIVDAQMLAALPAHALFVNTGRGKTVDESALIAALQAGTLRAAAVDVTYTEPLPAQDPLWECPNLLITPHVAGGRPIGASALILAQVQALVDSRPLRNVVLCSSK